MATREYAHRRTTPAWRLDARPRPAKLPLAPPVYGHRLGCGHCVERAEGRCAQAGDTDVDNASKVSVGTGNSLWIRRAERSRRIGGRHAGPTRREWAGTGSTHLLPRVARPGRLGGRAAVRADRLRRRRAPGGE